MQITLIRKDSNVEEYPIAHGALAPALFFAALRYVVEHPRNENGQQWRATEASPHLIPHRLLRKYNAGMILLQ